jgi:NADPH:quinone reductase-like Zn-dependent oxidoreductase
MVQSIGADHVIDYTRQDFTKSGQRYDVILDNVGNHSLLDVRRVLNPEGILVIIGGPNTGDWIGPMTQPVKAALLSPFISQEMGMILAELNPTDLGLVANLMQTGKVTPVIDRKYTLSEVPHAIAYLEEGHARGKVIVVPDQ